MSAGLGFAYSMGAKTGGIGLWVGLIAGLVAGISVFKGFSVLIIRLVKKKDTLRNKFPFGILFIAAAVSIFIAIVLASWIVKLLIYHVAPNN